MTRTEQLKKTKNTMFWISTILWMGTCLFLILYGFISNFQASSDAATVQENGESLSSKFTAVFGSLLVSFAIGVAIVIFLRNKCRNTVWMVNLVLAVYLFGTSGMWVILSIWSIDELIINPIYKKSKDKYTINKEIDLRG